MNQYPKIDITCWINDGAGVACSSSCTSRMAWVSSFRDSNVIILSVRSIKDDNAMQRTRKRTHDEATSDNNQQLTK